MSETDRTRLPARQDLLLEAALFLQENGVAAARLEAELLLGGVLGCRREHLLAYPEEPVETGERERYRGLLRQRAGGMPLQYLLGERDFWGRSFAVRPGVLIPRSDTETLVQAVLDHRAAAGPGDPLILDLGTGTGVVAITLARELPGARVFAVDISARAVALCRENARRHRAGVTVLAGDLYGALLPEGPRAFDIIVSNPPYVTSREMEGLPPEVRREPRRALWGGTDGLRFHRRILAGAPDHLRPGGLLALEIGEAQGAAVAGLFERQGFADVGVQRDPGDRDRVVTGRWKP